MQSGLWKQKNFSRARRCGWVYSACVAIALVVTVSVAGVQAQSSTQTFPACPTLANLTPPASGVADFGVAASPNSISVVQGGASTIVLKLAPFASFSGYVSLSCSNLTPDAQCTFVPDNAFVGGSAPTSASLSIATFGPTGPKADIAGHARLVYAFVFPGLLGLAGLGLRGRRSLQQLSALLVVAAVSGGVLGCSQRYHYLNKQPQASTGTPIGASSFIVQAQSISGTVVISHSCTLPLAVTAP